MDTTLQPRRDATCGSAEIEQRARELLDTHSHFLGRSRQIEFACRDEVLIVRGMVPTFYLKQMLQTVLKELEGVRLVQNQVTVISSGGFSDMRERVGGPIG
ncbi:MAG: BON domain-containing protein [Pirellulales bacterium]